METLFFSSLLHTLTFLPPVIPHASFCSFMHNQGWLCGSQRQTHQQNIALCIVTQLYFMSVREAEYSFHHCKLHFSNGIACYNFFFFFFLSFTCGFNCGITMQTANTTIPLSTAENRSYGLYLYYTTAGPGWVRKPSAWNTYSQKWSCPLQL